MVISANTLENNSRVFNRDNVEQHWGAYFAFEGNAPLHSIPEELLLAVVEGARSKESPFIDSQRVVGKILTDLGGTHKFHRQFNETFPDLKPNYVLGMQLYRIMVEDKDAWVYYETRHPGHMYSHATYFIPKITSATSVSVE